MESATIFIALLIMLFLTVMTLSVTVYILVRLIVKDNESKTYLLTRLFMQLGQEEGLTLEDQQQLAREIYKDVKDSTKPFNPHEELKKQKGVEKPFDPDEFDV